LRFIFKSSCWYPFLPGSTQFGNGLAFGGRVRTAEVEPRGVHFNDGRELVKKLNPKLVPKAIILVNIDSIHKSGRILMQIAAVSSGKESGKA